MATASAALGFDQLPPEPQRVWLPAGTPREIGLDPRAIELLFRDPDAEFVATLDFDPAGEVIACIGDVSLGELDYTAGAELSPILRTLEGRGLTAVVEGAFSQGSAMVFADPKSAATHPATPPLGAASVSPGTPDAEGFSADTAAAEAAIAADAERDCRRSAAYVRGMKRTANPRVLATVAAAVVLGLSGTYAYHSTEHDAERKITAFVHNSQSNADTPSRNGAGTAAPATPVKPKTQESSSSQSPTPSPTGSLPDAAESEPAPASARTDGSAEAPAAPAAPAAANVPAPAPRPAPAPAPAPAAPAAPEAPAAPAGPGIGAGPLLPPGAVPLFEIEW